MAVDRFYKEGGHSGSSGLFHALYYIYLYILARPLDYNRQQSIKQRPALPGPVDSLDSRRIIKTVDPPYTRVSTLHKTRGTTVLPSRSIYHW